MEKLSNAGRIFYGISIAVLGFQSVYFADFPYMLIPPNHAQLPGLAALAYLLGSLFIAAGLSITCTIKTGVTSVLLGNALLLVFCFYYLPYEFFVTKNYMHLVEWDNAGKELALAGGALVIANNYPASNRNAFMQFLAKLAPLGTTLFAAAITSFGIDHFLYANGVAEYMPKWIPGPVFCAYLAGVPLLTCGIAILFNIQRRFMATVLGVVIFTWFIIIHIPKMITSPFADTGSETTSAFLALAYSGTALAIAGRKTNRQERSNDKLS
ncbi:MAG TPA: hypothetical protein VG738_06520 [Chitinophagaceae bacterium]|nr:hypothetical protein [Chitinophagaceae bacterium]